MKPLRRRSVIAGSAAAVTVIPAVGLCAAASDASELHRLIDAHRKAYKAFSDAVDSEGEDPGQRWEQTEKAEYQAFVALCSYKCHTLDETYVKASYLLTTAIVSDMWKTRRRRCSSPSSSNARAGLHSARLALEAVATACYATRRGGLAFSGTNCQLGSLQSRSRARGPRIPQDPHPREKQPISPSGFSSGEVWASASVGAPFLRG